MTRTFHFEINGTAAKGQTWKAAGYIVDPSNDLTSVFNEAMRTSFEQLTEGKAVYGRPGVGCSGPYDVKKIVIEQR